MAPVLHVPMFARLDEYFSGPWLIEPTRAAQLWSMAQALDLAAHVGQQPGPLQPTSSSTDQGGKRIAVLQVRGLMMKQQSSIGFGTSTVQLRKDLRAAAADPGVAGILMQIESPGGNVAGMEELAAEASAAGARKPLWAQIEDVGASAAYWLAAMAGRIYANVQTAIVGSIGTYATLYDASGKAERDGVKALVFSTGPLKATGAIGAPITDEQKAYMQGLVDSAQQVFDAALQNGPRRLTAAELAAVRSGAGFPAQEAQRLRLIDGIQTFEQTIAAFAAELGGRPIKPLQKGQSTMADTTTATATIPTPTAQPSADVTAAVQAERARVGEIESICGVMHGLPVAGQQALATARTQAIAGNLTVDGLSAIAGDLVRSSRPSGGFYVGSGSRLAMTPSCLSAAILVSIGREKVAEQTLGAQTMEASRPLRGMSLPELCRMALQIDGRPIPSSRDGIIQAAFSTGSMPVALAETATITILAAYRDAPSAWRQFAAVKPAADFRPQSSVRPSVFGEVEQLAPTGEITHATWGEESMYSWKVDTYAKILSIDRRDIVNGTALGVFDDVLPGMARMAARGLTKLVWVTFMDNSAFFTAPHGNYAAGAGTALSITSLNTALQMLRAQVDAEGNNVDIGPVVLVVPPGLELTARALLNSIQLMRDQSADMQPQGNPLLNIVALIVAPQLANTAYTGYSNVAWYLLAGPADAPMVVGFLDGNEVPKLETFGFDADPNVLAQTWRVYHDFGAALGDWRAAVKMKGEA